MDTAWLAPDRLWSPRPAAFESQLGYIDQATCLQVKRTAGDDVVLLIVALRFAARPTGAPLVKFPEKLGEFL